MIWGVIGPLYEPRSRSGVHFTEAEEQGSGRMQSGAGNVPGTVGVPPCMRPGWTPEKALAYEAERREERAAYLRDLAAWRARRDVRAAADLTTNDPDGSAA